MTTRASILSSCLYRISIGIVFLLVLCTRCYADNTDAYIKELTDIVSEAVSVYGRIGGCFGTDTMGKQEVQEVRKTKQLVFTIFGGEKKNDYKGINFIFLFI